MVKIIVIYQVVTVLLVYTFVAQLVGRKIGEWKVAGSNPAPAKKKKNGGLFRFLLLLYINK